jgi:hypothetical protein
MNIMYDNGNIKGFALYGEDCESFLSVLTSLANTSEIDLNSEGYTSGKDLKGSTIIKKLLDDYRW